MTWLESASSTSRYSWYKFTKCLQYEKKEFVQRKNDVNLESLRNIWFVMIISAPIITGVHWPEIQDSSYGDNGSHRLYSVHWLLPIGQSQASQPSGMAWCSTFSWCMSRSATRNTADGVGEFYPFSHVRVGECYPFPRVCLWGGGLHIIVFTFSRSNSPFWEH